MTTPRLPPQQAPRLAPQPEPAEEIRPSKRVSDDVGHTQSIIQGNPALRESLSNEFNVTGKIQEWENTASNYVALSHEQSDEAHRQKALDDVAKINSQAEAISPEVANQLVDELVVDAAIKAKTARTIAEEDPVDAALRTTLIANAQAKDNDGEYDAHYKRIANQIALGAHTKAYAVQEEMNKLRNYHERSWTDEGVGKDGRSPKLRETIDEIGVMILSEMTPILNLVDNTVVSGLYEAVTGTAYSDTLPEGYVEKLLAEGGADTGGTDSVLSNLREVLTGELHKSLAQYIKDLPADEKVAATERFYQYLEANDIVLTDATLRHLSHRIIGQYLDSGNVDNVFSDTLENVFAPLDIVIGAAAVKNVIRYAMKAFGRTTRSASPTTQVMTQVDKAAVRDDYIEMVLVDGEYRMAGDTGATANPTRYPVGTPHIGGSGGTPIKGTEVTIEQVVASQLPKPFRMFGNPVNDDTVSGVLSEAENLALLKVRGQLEGTQTTVEQIPNIRDKAQQQTIRERERAAIYSSFGGRVNASKSTTQVAANGTETTFRVIVGMDDVYGYSNVQDAILEALRISNDGSDVRIKSSDGTSLTPYMEGSEMEAALTNWRAGIGQPANGDFYIEAKYTHIMRSSDRGLFDGDTPPITNEVLGRARGWITDPSTDFNPAVYQPYVQAYKAQQSLTSNLDRIVAPVMKQRSADRRYIGDVYRWMASTANKTGQRVSRNDIMEAFPSTTPTQLKGVALVQRFYDEVYRMQNRMVHREYESRRFKTLSRGAVQIHGKPMTAQEFAADSGIGKGTRSVFDPETRQSVTLTRKEIDDLEAKGGSILKTEHVIATDGGARHYYVLNSPQNAAWTLGKLSDRPLRYEEHYYPRMYEDTLLITNTKTRWVDGVEKEIEEAIAIVGTQRQAEAYIRNVSKRSKNAAESYKISADSRVSGMDKAAVDRLMLQMEGRLYFDNRGAHLRNADGRLADTVDPINMLNRTSRAVADIVAMSDLTKGMKTSFVQQYEPLFRSTSQFDYDVSSKVTAHLQNKLATGNASQKAMAGEALEVWGYIRLMEGSVNEGSQVFRRGAIASAELLHEILTGVPAASRATEYMYRNIHRFSATETLKSLAFFDYMTTRPIRQLTMQASQHQLLAVLDPTYLKQWEFDNFHVISGLKKQAVELMGGKKLSAELLARSAKGMNLTPQELTLLLKKVDQAGETQQVNVHSYHGNAANQGTRTPQTQVGDVVEAAVKPVTTLAKWMQAIGFDLGEQWNVVASFNMALNLYKKENGVTNLLKISDEGWNEIIAKASDYAGGMIRPNSAKYQRGLISVATQFMAHSHKMMLIGSKAVTGYGASLVTLGRASEKAKAGIGSQFYTREQAAKILASQAVIWGAGGYGMQEAASRVIEATGLNELPDVVKDAAINGIADMMFEKAIELALNDPDVDLPFPETLAPMSGSRMIGEKMLEAAIELSPWEFIQAIPAAGTLSRYYEHAKMGAVIMRSPVLDNEERIVALTEVFLSGVAKGMDDAFIAATWYRLGQLTDSSDNRLAHEAKMDEILAKGWLGMNPQSVAAEYNVWKDLQDGGASEQSHLDKVAMDFHKQMQAFTTRYMKDTDSQKVFIQKTQELGILLASLPEEQRLYIEERVWALDSQSAPRESIIHKLTEKAFSSESVAAVSIYDIENLNATEEEKAVGIKAIRDQETSLAEIGDYIINRGNEEND